MKTNKTNVQGATEHAEQVAFVSWMNNNHPTLRLFAIPNGGSRNKLEAMKLKEEGVSSGVPDLMIPALSMFIEMKRSDGGVLSENQRSWINYLNSCGYMAIKCHGCKEAIEAVERRLAESTTPT